MNQALSEAPPTASSPDPDADDSAARAFGIHVRDTPPLSWLSAIAALTAMLLGQVLLPALAAPTRRELLFRVERYADFAQNLAAISGLLALGFGLFAFVRYSTSVGARQRLLLAAFSGIFLPTIAVATLFERQRTTTQIVLFALGAAYVLGALVTASAARVRSQRYPRMLAILAAAMATLSLVAQVLQLMSQTWLNAWVLQTFEATLSLGEICYLLLLVSFAPVVLPARNSTRDRLARMLAFFLLPLLMGGMYYAAFTLKSDYALVLYHAQRVSLFIDEAPRLYSVPLGIGLASAIAGGLSSDPLRRQGAAGLLLLLSAGFSPHAPGRLLSLTLALLLMARTLIAPIERPPATATD